MRLPGLFTSLGLASKKGIEEERLMLETQGVLLDTILRYLPAEKGNPSRHFHDALVDSLRQFKAETCQKAKRFIEEQSFTHKVAALVVDVLNRRDSDAAMNRIIDNFDFITGLGWTFAGSLPGMILGSFPSSIIYRDLTIDQQHSLIRLHDAQYEKNFTPSGGGKNQILRLKCSDLTELVVERTEDVDRIIIFAKERNPETVEDYLALLESGSATALSSGAL